MSDVSLLALFGACIILIGVIILVRQVRTSQKTVETLGQHILQVERAMQDVRNGHSRLSGGMEQMTSGHMASQAKLVDAMERRLDALSQRMGDSLEGSTRKTVHSLGELQQRLQAIDKAQANIESLSSNVLSLQDILSNKQARGAFGEIQLLDLISNALPPRAYAMQASLSNGRRADCLVHLPYPPGPIVVDSKFPLESYQQIVAAKTDAETKVAAQAFRTAMKKHIRDIAERYIIPEETADCALLFLPSEAVYAQLHATFTDIVHESFQARVFIVSPSTLMAMLNTIRAVLKDARMREQTSVIRRELSVLFEDVARLGDRVEKLDTHFEQAAKDIKTIRTSASKISRRAEKLESLEFEES